MKLSIQHSFVKKAPSNLRIPGTIARDLGTKIVSGMLHPGMVLEGEVEASDQRKVSRSAYREAVRILVAKGLVNSRPKAGTRVNDRSAWHLLDPDVLSWIFQIEPDYTLVYSLFELRRMVEPEAAALAAERRGPHQLKPMATALDVMTQHKPNSKEWREADEQFHAALLEASGNAFLASMTSSINAAISWSTIFKQRYEPLKRDPMPDHRKVFKAIEDGNAAAARRAMAQLVDLALIDITTAPKWPGIINGAKQTPAARAKAKKSKR
ncbi:MAG TPA: FCD domain-containing protein [Rhizomicrobium sp.]|jgi:DNA-binding FadR family transcriptional regulator|nr:FCD domain-containing protein [Rhizomicrobium sp.]